MFKIFLSLSVVIILASVFSSAKGSGLTFGFSNPSFSGNGQSAHYLTIENIEKTRQDTIDAKKVADAKALKAELAATAIEKFKTNLEARFYTALAKQITDGVFGSTGVANPSGAYTSPNGEVVNWYKNTTTGTVNGIPAETVRVTILKDGVTTTIDYPYADSE